MDLAAVCLLLFAVALGAWGLAGRLGRRLLPAAFAVTIGCLLVAYLGAVEQRAATAAFAGVGAAVAVAGLSLLVLRLDFEMAAEEIGAIPISPWSFVDRRRRWREFERHFWPAVAAHAWARGRQAAPPAQAGPRSGSAEVEESLHSLDRPGRPSLFVLVRRDPYGRLLDAAAFDPEDYL